MQPQDGPLSLNPPTPGFSWGSWFIAGGRNSNQPASTACRVQFPAKLKVNLVTAHLLPTLQNVSANSFQSTTILSSAKRLLKAG